MLDVDMSPCSDFLLLNLFHSSLHILALWRGETVGIAG